MTNRHWQTFLVGWFTGFAVGTGLGLYAQHNALQLYQNEVRERAADAEARFKAGKAREDGR